MLKYTNTEEALLAFLNDVKKQARKNLKSGGHIASKDLYNNIKASVKESKSGNSFTATLEMEDYAAFMDAGVKGVKSGKSLKGYKYTNKKPPIRFIKTWLKQKRGRFRERDLDSLAFRIQNTIYLKGIKPTEFYSKPFEKEFQKLPQELVEAYALDVEQFLEFLTKK